MTTRDAPVPVVMPLVEARFGAEGTATVTIDHAPYNEDAQVCRGDLDGLLREIATSLGPIRVEVTEPDGLRFTDIVLPDPAASAAPGEPPQLPFPGAAGSGFLPGEEVDVAVIVAHQSADDRGCTELRLPAAALNGTSSTIVLLGRGSGRYTVCETP